MKSGKGYALQFDGVDDYVDCGDVSSFKFKGSFSPALWAAHDRIAGWQDYVGNYVGGVSAYVIAQNGGRLHFHNGGLQPYTLDADPVKLSPGIWYHIAAIYDRQAGTMKICLDGMEATVQKVKGRPKPSLSDNLRIGKYQGLRECFHEVLDQVRIYGRALSEEEIMAQYAADPRSRDKEELRRLALETFFYPDADKAVLSTRSRSATAVASRSSSKARPIGLNPATRTRTAARTG